MNLLDLLPPPATDLESAFQSFHRRNPHVYEQLRDLALLLQSKGHKRIGIKMLFEQLRWLHALQTTDMTGFKLNNNYTAYYSRMLMEREPRLVGFFETREPRRVYGGF